MHPFMLQYSEQQENPYFISVLKAKHGADQRSGTRTHEKQIAFFTPNNVMKF